MNIKIVLKGIRRLGKYDNSVTMARSITKIKNTKFSLANNKQIVNKIIIRYCSFIVFILNIICFIINKTHKNPVIVRYNNWRVLEFEHLPIYYMITCIFNFSTSGKI